MGRQKPSAAPHEQPVRPTWLPRVIHLAHIVFSREQRCEDDAPGAAAAVELGGFEWVVEFYLFGKLVAGDEHHRRYESADYSGPRLHHWASGGDGCEAAEEAVANVGDVPVAGEDAFAEEGG